MTDGEEVTGRSAMNRIWKAGDTIRRSRGPWSETTAALLRHLERRGFTAAPRYLGVDELGRDILSALPGEPVATLTGDAQLVQVARLLRAFYDATADSPRPPVPGGGYRPGPGPAGVSSTAM